MSTARLMHLVLAVLILSGLGAAPATQPAEAASRERIKSLEQMLSAMMARNEMLQMKNAALEWQVRQLQSQLASFGLSPRPAPLQSPVPEGWAVRKFNGTDFYLVPLDEARRTAPTTRPAGK